MSMAELQPIGQDLTPASSPSGNPSSTPTTRTWRNSAHSLATEDAKVLDFMVRLKRGEVVATEPDEPEEEKCTDCQGYGWLRYGVENINDPHFGKVYPCHCKEPEIRQRQLTRIFG